MALQLGATREAFIAAGAPADKAGAAAEELAGYNSEFTGLRADMREGFAKVDQRFAVIEGRLSGVDGRLNSVDARLTLLTWVIGIQASVTLVILASTFALWSKLGDIGGQVAQIARSVH